MELATPGAMAEVSWFVHICKNPATPVGIVGFVFRKTLNDQQGTTAPMPSSVWV